MICLCTMGIKLPPPDEDLPPGLSPGWLTICGIQVNNMPGFVCPANGTFQLNQIAPGSFQRLFPDMGGYPMGIAAFAAEGESQVLVNYPGSWAYYRNHQNRYALSGSNQLTTGYFRGGTHVLSWTQPVDAGSLITLADELILDRNHKVFAENAGCSADGTRRNIRLAQQRQGTCVYIKQT